MKRLPIIISCVFIAISLFLTTAFAWYTNVQKIDSMSFDILQINSLVTMYEANDSNYNGVPDYLTGNTIDHYQFNNESREYQSKYHQEWYSFKYLDQKYAFSEDSEANLLNKVSITNFAPSRIYCYKFEITNYSTQINYLDFTFDDETTTISNLNLFEVRLGTVDVNNNISFSNWTSFVTNDSYSGISLNPSVDRITIPATSVDYKTSADLNGRLDIWLQIRMKSNVTTQINDFSLPHYRITLSVENV